MTFEELKEMIGNLSTRHEMPGRDAIKPKDYARVLSYIAAIEMLAKSIHNMVELTSVDHTKEVMGAVTAALCVKAMAMDRLPSKEEWEKTIKDVEQTTLEYFKITRN